MLSTQLGRPTRADSMTISQKSLTSLSGLTGQVPMTIIGRSRTASSLPCTAASMSTVGARRGRPARPPEIGLVWLTMAASWLCRLNVSGGLSPETDGHLEHVHLGQRVDQPGDVAEVLLGRRRAARRSYGSMTLMPSPKLLKPTRPGSRQMSFFGSRPQQHHAWAARWRWRPPRRAAGCARCASRGPPRSRRR